MAIQSSYGPGNALTSSFDLRGMDIGPMPNFYGDIDEMIRKLRPLPMASQQATALRSPTPMPMQRGGESMASPAAGGGGLDYGSVTPRSLGRLQMNQTGNWGTFVDPADIPAALQDRIMGGFYGGPGNWDTSNPSIMGPQQWRTGKYGGR